MRTNLQYFSVRLVALFLLINALSLSLLATHNRNVLLNELAQASFILHREASQRADQHDAHLTALSTIAQSNRSSQYDLFLEVAATIIRFYQRIDEVQLVPVRVSAPVIGTRELTPDIAEAIRAAARSSQGLPELLAPPERPGHYLIVKRSPNSDAFLDGLAISINAASLIASEDPFWARDNIERRISMPDGKVLSSSPASFTKAQFSRPLGSATQPLIFEAGIRIGWKDFLPLAQLLITLVITNLFFFSGLAIVRQRRRTRNAERRAELSGFEARLAHASRVNTMGEMASGMAHELTQPLTAILAGAQAGRRLLTRQDYTTLDDALEDMVDEARRASSILDRLRNWSRPQRQRAAPVDLRRSLQNVQALLAAETTRHHVKVELRLPSSPLIAAVDPVEMEQIMFNLLRNAIEAFPAEQTDRQVTASLRTIGQNAILEVTDNGPGVAPELRPRLFTPFVTTRPEGTGLGLALSQRLAERVGGEIVYIPQDQGAFFRVTLPLAESAGDEIR
ncbi:two-component sensor histidine kinase [Ochrobactrum sp. CM-21-5]|nr:two-component sensor histidine kinase [Ochrobactrum sp. CM-21-5]